MIEEEKKAIERIKDLISKSKVIEDIEINKHIAFKDIETILNLIEKQLKEIEELKYSKNKIEDIELEEKFESLLDDLKLSIKTLQRENKDILTKEMTAIRVKELFELWKNTLE